MLNVGPDPADAELQALANSGVARAGAPESRMQGLRV